MTTAEKALKEVIKNLYNDNKSCDIIIEGKNEVFTIGFHKLVLDIWVKSSIFDLDDLRNMDEIVVGFIKKILYIQEVNLDTDLPLKYHVTFYIFQDKYQLNLDYILSSSNSMDLLLYLLETSDNNTLVRAIDLNLKFEKTDKLITPLPYDIYYEIYRRRLNKDSIYNNISTIPTSASINELIWNSYNMNPMQALLALKKLWEETKDTNVLHFYALKIKYFDPVEARKLFWQNWETYSNHRSLYQYANMLAEGQGGEIDEDTSISLFRKNWEDNECVDSMYSYAVMLNKGYGVTEDKKMAHELFKKSWERHRYIPGLIKYIDSCPSSNDAILTLYAKYYEKYPQEKEFVNNYCEYLVTRRSYAKAGDIALKNYKYNNYNEAIETYIKILNEHNYTDHSIIQNLDKLYEEAQTTSAKNFIINSKRKIMEDN